MATATVRRDEQLQLVGEEIVNNADLVALLEEREALKSDAGDARTAYRQAHEKALAALAALEIPVGARVRVAGTGYVIEHRRKAGRSVSFETEESTQLRILSPKEEE